MKAAQHKSLLAAGFAITRALLLLAVMLLWPENRVWAFTVAPQIASGQTAHATRSSVWEIPSPAADSASGCCVAAESVGPVVNKLAQVTQNRIAGNAFRDSLAASLKAAGRDVQTEVYKATPFGGRFIDIEVSKGGQVLGGIECKVGCSRYTPLQQLKDWWLKDAQGYIVNVARDR